MLFLRLVFFMRAYTAPIKDIVQEIPGQCTKLNYVRLYHSIGMNSRATQLKFWCPRMSHYAPHYHYGSQSIAFSGQ